MMECLTHSRNGVKNSKRAKMEEDIIKEILANVEEIITVEKGQDRKNQ